MRKAQIGKVLKMCSLRQSAVFLQPEERQFCRTTSKRHRIAQLHALHYHQTKFTGITLDQFNAEFELLLWCKRNYSAQEDSTELDNNVQKLRDTW